MLRSTFAMQGLLFTRYAPVIAVAALSGCPGGHPQSEKAASQRQQSPAAVSIVPLPASADDASGKPASPPSATNRVSPNASTETNNPGTLLDYLVTAKTMQVESGTSASRVEDQSAIRDLLHLLGERQIVDKTDPGVKCRGGLPLLRFYGQRGELGFILFCENVGMGSGWLRPEGSSAGGRITVRDVQGLKNWLAQQTARPDP